MVGIAPRRLNDQLGKAMYPYVNNVGKLIERIEQLEGFPVAITYRNGRHVARDLFIEAAYPYVHAAPGPMRVSEWKRRRIKPNFPNDLLVEVKSRRSRGWTPIHGSQLLDTVRNHGLRRRRRHRTRR